MVLFNNSSEPVQPSHTGGLDHILGSPSPQPQGIVLAIDSLPLLLSPPCGPGLPCLHIALLYLGGRLIQGGAQVCRCMYHTVCAAHRGGDWRSPVRLHPPSLVSYCPCPWQTLVWSRSSLTHSCALGHQLQLLREEGLNNWEGDRMTTKVHV